MHPREDVVGGLPAHRSIADVPEPVELAVIAVPAAAVVQVARECGAAGVRALVVLSAGFAEVGPRGRDLQAELLDVCRASGMRLVGPNCLGVLNTAADVGLERDLRAGRAAAGRRRVRVPERRVRHRGDRRGGAPRARPVLVRLDREQGRPLRQRPPAVLGERRRHRRDRAVPGVVRQPAPVRADRPPRGRPQAGDRGQERPLGRRSARRDVAHRSAARRVGLDGRRAVPARRRDPHRHRRRAVRRRRAARRPAAARRQPDRHRDERRRPRNRLRRRLRRRPACGSSRCRPGRAAASGSTCRARRPRRTPST